MYATQATMKTILEHNFKTQAHDLKALFNGVTKFATFCRRLEEQSLIDPDRYDSDKYKGDGFEFFVELFLMLHANDNRVGVYEYHPTQENDNGVDGYGVNLLLEKCVVQIKYRSNHQYLLTSNQDHLGNLITDGMGTHQVVYSDDPKNYRHFVFTTAEGLNYYTEEQMFKSKVRCFGYKDFRSMLDYNYVFWNNALNIVENL